MMLLYSDGDGGDGGDDGDAGNDNDGDDDEDEDEHDDTGDEDVAGNDDAGDDDAGMLMLVMLMHTKTVIWYMSLKSCGPGPISRATREKVVRTCNYHCICVVFVFLYICLLSILIETLKINC